MEDLIALNRLLSDRDLQRHALVGKMGETTKLVRISVLRNHSFELLGATIDAFLALSDLSAELLYSDYDDSFSIQAQNDSADVILIWVDLDRYDAAGRSMMEARFVEIATQAIVPVLIAPVCSDQEHYKALAALSEKLTVVDPSDIQSRLGKRFFDMRLAEFTGTRCSPRACLELSRLIGARALPSVLQTPLKAVVVDMDNTLYSGVLGEDGVNGVVMSDGHKALQQKVEAFAKQGGFVCVVSKNDARDVEALFCDRWDFPLKRTSITKVMANWNPKSENIIALEGVLNIHHSAMLFVDDNLGELYEVRSKLPDICLLWASGDAQANADAFSVYPGLARSGAVQAEDKIRSSDVQANEERRRRKATLSPEDYLRSLDVKIAFTLNCPEDGPRIHALANKTNQFIFNYMRYGETEVEQAVIDPDSCIVAARMSDKLVDSGIIGIAVLRRRAGHVLVEDLFVSCRALGRGLDDVVVLGMLQVAQERLAPGAPLKVEFQDGPRNQPARSFVDTYLASHLAEPAAFQYTFTNALIKISVPENAL